MSILNIFESDSEKAEREHNEGQKAGSEAGWLDQFSHNIGGGSGSDAYNDGWNNGLANPSQSDADADDD